MANREETHVTVGHHGPQLDTITCVTVEIRSVIRILQR